MMMMRIIIAITTAKVLFVHSASRYVALNYNYIITQCFDQKWQRRLCV